jgi:hypothetical protein
VWQSLDLRLQGYLLTMLPKARSIVRRVMRGEVTAFATCVMELVDLTSQPLLKVLANKNLW